MICPETVHFWSKLATLSAVFAVPSRGVFRKVLPRLTPTGCVYLIHG
ncbi:hypothetical protein KPSA3_03399 [Pseudomonas syringae pv. actinidiae]|uniref:Uncharacterized protein n=1 Tax=Pseudomonas syringae pv. actinidiae TaxID=103796 RepID=A0AAN4TLR3_PSESF|nr:hypothetical protein KPSA3_03399 [Pseudomonas syringae pv. actinidiae]